MWKAILSFFSNLFKGKSKSSVAPPKSEIGADSAPKVVNGVRQVSKEGIELVKHFEGLYLNAYLDEVGIATIGWGFTGIPHDNGSVRLGMKITEAKAEEYLRLNMQEHAEIVQRLVKVPLNDDEFAALVSFSFNLGKLGASTLLKKLNKGDKAGAADEFLKWVYAGGKVLKGLVRRRKSEFNLFLGKRPFIEKI